MGSLSVDDVLKLLKVLYKTKQLKKRRRKRKKYMKGLVDNNVKSVSNHMTGNIITGEHLRSIQDNNALKMKAIQNEIDNNNNNKFNVVNDTINDFKMNTVSYLMDHQNKLNNLSNIMNQSLSRDNTKKYTNNNVIVTESDPYLSMSSEANLQPDPHSQEEKDENTRTFSTIDETIKPSNLTTDNSPLIQEVYNSDDEEKYYTKDDAKDDEEIKNDNNDEIIEEEETKNENNNAVIEDDNTEKENINNSLLHFLNYHKDISDKDKSKISKGQKKEIYGVLRYYGESNPNAKLNYTIYNKFKKIALQNKLINEE